MAFVLAAPNGSGKSSLWHSCLDDRLLIPLINVDRLTASILPPPDEHPQLPAWVQRLRDEDDHWQELSQQGVIAFRELVMGKAMPSKLCSRIGSGSLMAAINPWPTTSPFVARLVYLRRPFASLLLVRFIFSRVVPLLSLVAFEPLHELIQGASKNEDR